MNNRVLIIDDGSVGTIERRNDHDFRANIASGSTVWPIRLTAGEKALAHDAHKKAGLAFSCIDLIDSQHGPLLV